MATLSWQFHHDEGLVRVARGLPGVRRQRRGKTFQSEEASDRRQEARGEL